MANTDESFPGKQRHRILVPFSIGKFIALERAIMLASKQALRTNEYADSGVPEQFEAHFWVEPERKCGSCWIGTKDKQTIVFLSDVHFRWLEEETPNGCGSSVSPTNQMLVVQKRAVAIRSMACRLPGGNFTVHPKETFYNV